ncbi:HAD family hydrolase [Cohnella laeviribosi]|uniref:HAD family hydrolase n=1 Tax=Cohnella laeviribosi TaxID=380174 RepID=UPI003D23811C
MKHKIALFDIDKTIISNDSMFSFLWYGIKKKPWMLVILFPVIFFTIVYKLNLIKEEKVKEYYFFAIKFLGEDDLRDFYKSMLENKIYNSALQELQSKKKQDYYVLLVSASPYSYIKFFKSIPYVDGVIGTELVFKNGRYINKIKGKNCKGDEKVRRIKEYLCKLNLEIDFNNSCAYSDSLSDLPMLQLVKNKYLINKKNKLGIEVLFWK